MLIIDLADIAKENKLVGGKGAHLGEMIKAGLPIPPGFVITTTAYDVFIKQNNLGDKIQDIISNTDMNDPKTLESASRKIEELMVNSNIPDPVEKAILGAYEELSVGPDVKNITEVARDLVKAGRETFVAVRSSATAEDLPSASFAGQMKTFLNVRGNKDLLVYTKLCWASLYTPRAIFYRKTKNITVTVSIGVIVQKMVNAEKAGVIFTADPATSDRTKIVIEGTWGLGEAVVSGLVIPDVYVLDKESGQLISKKISKKEHSRTRDKLTGKTVETEIPPEKVDIPLLDEKELAKLFELAKKVENHYGGKPQDIEWCEERDRIFFVQTRPITTLEMPISEARAAPEGPVILEGLAASPGVATGAAKIVMEMSDLEKIQKGDILVAKMTNPDFVQYMKSASAIVTDEGGTTAHAAIISRELGIPCIVGTRNATTTLADGQEITVDGGAGKVYSGKVEAKPAAPVIETEGFTATEIKSNIAFPETAAKVAAKADGVGLLRAEHMLTEAGQHPVYLAKENPEELIRIIMEGLSKIAKALYPKPVWYRTLDARTDEFRQLSGGENEPQEANPMLGWHGIRRALDEPDVLKCEVEAIKRLHQQGLTNIAIMLPFICKVEELRKAKGFIPSSIKLGIMVETPAAAMSIEDFCKEGISFASIGSNDLTQLALGIDRGETRIAKLYSELDPGVMALMARTIRICKKYGVESSICGESASRPEMAEKLVELGIDSLSVEMDALDEIRSVVARTERRLILERIRHR